MPLLKERLLLDVYKRQILFNKESTYHIQFMDGLKNTLLFVVLNVCLLYTSSFFGYEQALSLAKQEGAELFKDETTPNINGPEFTKAMQTLKEIVDLGGCSDEGEDNLQLFMAGEARCV